MTPIQESRNLPTSFQHWLFALYLVFVVYGSLVPFHFVYIPLDDVLARFQNLPFLDLSIDSRADWVANLLLFVPLTFLAGMVWVSPLYGVRRMLANTLLTLMAIALAITIEFSQLYFPGRTAGQNDIYAESIGAAIGILCHHLFGVEAQKWLNGFWRSEMRRSRIGRLLDAYLIVFIAFSVIPLDITISPVELYHKWSENRIILVPFSGHKGGLLSVYKYMTDLIIWVPVGLFWTMQGPKRLGEVVVYGFSVSLSIELAQLFVFSRVTSITDVILGAVGSAFGFCIYRLAAGRLKSIGLAIVSHWQFLWLVWLTGIISIFWFPFNFELINLSATAMMDAFTRLPFKNYYMTSEYKAINELVRKFAFFFPGGLLIGLSPYQHLASHKDRLWVVVAGLCLTAVIVEFGQLLLPGKVADLTDALLESSGGVVGYLTGRWLAKPDTSVEAIAFTNSQPAVQRRPLSTLMHALVRLTLLTVLVGIATKAPGMHYDVRNLVAPGTRGYVTVVGLALAIYWIAHGTLLIAPRTRATPRWFLAYPILLFGHACATWCVLRLVTPNDNFLKIVGTPVLNWWWETEPLLRYIALHMSIVTQMLGAILFVRVLIQPNTLVHFVYWLLISLTMAWPLYLIVIDWAATDNLTELLRYNGSFLASSSLIIALFLTCVAASAFSAAIGTGLHLRRLLCIAGVAIPSAWGMFLMGLEPTIFKYDRVFSALQFLLSEDRNNYAQGNALYFRFVLAVGAFVTVLAILQLPCWPRQPLMPGSSVARQRHGQ